jgi:hypothetical protein
MKELRPDPLNMLFPVIICGGLWTMCVFIAFGRGKTVAAAQIAGFTCVLFVVLWILLTRHRIILTNDELIVESLFRKQVIQLKHIVTSQVSISRRSPGLLEIYDKIPNDRTEPIGTVPLKFFKKREAVWLIDHPAIKLDQ